MRKVSSARKDRQLSYLLFLGGHRFLAVELMLLCRAPTVSPPYTPRTLCAGARRRVHAVAKASDRATLCTLCGLLERAGRITADGPAFSPSAVRPLVGFSCQYPITFEVPEDVGGPLPA